MEEALAQAAYSIDVIDYDDSWPGMRAYLADPPYVLTDAPWYDPGIPQSRELMGFWVTSTEGFGPPVVQRQIVDAIGPGGVTSAHRDQYRSLTVEFTIVATTNAGAEYGISWLDCQLAAAKEWDGTTLEFLAAHPQGSAVNPAWLRRIYNRVVLTREIRVSSRKQPVEPNSQARIMVADFELGVLDPYTYGPASTELIAWETIEAEPIEWAHPPDCESPDACTSMPILASVTCVPSIIDVRPVTPPVCTGCIPVCEVETRVAPLPAAAGVLCRDQAVSVTITAGAGPVSANFWLRPCGNDALCDRTGFLTVAGLPAGGTVVADSVVGRAYAIVDGARVDQRSIVATPAGAPWSPVVVDHGQCWELVAQHEPGLDYTVSVSVRGRS